MQTLSKAFGLAGIRLGAAFASTAIARLLNNLKAPYNISSPTSTLANLALRSENLAIMQKNRTKLLQQQDRLVRNLPQIPGIGRLRGGADSNFLLVEVLDQPWSRGGRPSNEVAMALYERLAELKGVIVRFRGKEYGCTGCLRITVGTSEEVSRLLEGATAVLADILKGRDQLDGVTHEAGKEREANNVIA